jgi:hypothetical protein
MVEACSESEAVGRVGSKNPCECWRGRCLWRSDGGGPRGEAFLAGVSFCDIKGAEGREKLGSAVLLLFVEEVMFEASRGKPEGDDDCWEFAAYNERFGRERFVT